MCKKYEFKIMRFKRGQVWLCTEDQNVTNALRAANVKALNGTRPYLIISVNGGMLSCVPMTTNTSGRDTRDSDIVFRNPETDTESRIVVSQICTKGSNELTKYLYSFSDEDTRLLINLTKVAIFDCDDTFVNPVETSDVKPEPVKETDDIQKEHPNETETEDPLVKLLDERLTKRKKKNAPLFLTAQEAAVWLNRWENEKVYVVAKYYGITNDKVYSWKHQAKRKVKEG